MSTDQWKRPPRVPNPDPADHLSEYLQETCFFDTIRLEDDMEKNSVVQPKKPAAQKPGEKTASSSSPKCPICGSTAIRHGTALVCKTHGSAPWE